MSYNNSCIYKLSCNDKHITDCYVGSTTNFERRKYDHNRNCNNKNSKKYHFKVYQFIRDNGGWSNWSMEIIEEVNVNDGNELKKLERKYIESLNSSLNCVIPTRSDKEYYEKNKERINEYSKEYCLNNKEKIAEKKKKYYQNNKEKVIEKAKEYRENNREKRNEKLKEYYENNKKQLNEKRKVKIECEFCKSFVRKSGIARHKKTKKCMDTQPN